MQHIIWILLLSLAASTTAQTTTITGISSKSRKCPPNEQFNECGTACEPSCANPKPEICTLQCVVGCQCKSGFYRNSKGVCVSDCRGDQAHCGKNEERKQCGTACEPTCSNRSPVCTKQCVVNVCQCKSGYIRDAYNKCISYNDCPREPSVTCANVRCRDGTTCKMINNRPQCVAEPYNPCAVTICPFGFECRVKQVQCIRAPCDPIAECYYPNKGHKCGKNESFRECASHCEPSCKEKSPTCILSCAPGKCQCNSGFYRNSSGKCVTKAECDANGSQ